MKTTKIYNSILAAAMAFGLAACSQSQPQSEEKADGAIECIMTRSSVRDYQDMPVEDEKIETMLRAAMAAPSAVNKQPWRFIVIKDKNTLKAISENFRSMRMAEKAALAIVVCGDMNATLEGEGREYWVQDASAATENLLLAANSLGLGAVWCGIYPIQERVALLKEMLSIPEDITPLNVVPIGYPADDPTPKDKWDPSKIHYETWTAAQ